jgi:hypothetical protein
MIVSPSSPPANYKHNDNVFKLSIPTDFVLAPSKYIYELTRKTEYGIFTKLHIKKNEILGQYKGVVFISPDNDTHEALFHRCYERDCKEGSFLLKNDRYSMLIENRIIDASIQRKGSFLRYVNTGFPNYYMNNCEFRLDGYCVATRDIFPGEELLCSYGANTENNILDINEPTFSIHITEITPPGEDMFVTYTECRNVDAHTTQKMMRFDTFLERYYEILRSHLLKKRKYKVYQTYFTAKKPVTQSNIYSLSELEKYKDSEISLFLQRIKETLDSLSQKKLSRMKLQHYNLLKDYYENKKSKI